MNVLNLKDILSSIHSFDEFELLKLNPEIFLGQTNQWNLAY